MSILDRPVSWGQYTASLLSTLALFTATAVLFGCA